MRDKKEKWGQAQKGEWERGVSRRDRRRDRCRERGGETDRKREIDTYLKDNYKY